MPRNHKTIAILGGSFDPPHIGHIDMAESVLSKNMADEVWLTPCGDVHSFGKSMSPATDRLKMCRLLATDKIKVHDDDIKGDFKGRTFWLMWHLKETYPNHTFWFIIGADNAARFREWYQYKKLLTEAHFIIFPRGDYEIDPVFKKGLVHRTGFSLTDRNIIMTMSPPAPISSTLVRELLRLGQMWWPKETGKLLSEFLDGKVLEYIKKKRLYQ